MKLKDIIALLEEMCPKTFAEKWDNVGLLVGSPEMEVHTVGIALDATTEVINEAAAQGVDLLLTHHPMIFCGLKEEGQAAGIAENGLVGHAGRIGHQPDLLVIKDPSLAEPQIAEQLRQRDPLL